MNTVVMFVFHWPEQEHTGCKIPEQPETRLDVLSELLSEEQPIFEFEPGEMTVDRRFLVDFGFARIRQPDS